MTDDETAAAAAALVEALWRVKHPERPVEQTRPPIRNEVWESMTRGLEGLRAGSAR